MEKFDIKRLLKYQDINKELMQLENSISGSDVYKECAKLGGQVQAAQDNLLKLNRDAGELMNIAESMNSTYEQLTKQCAELEKSIAGCEDDKQLEFYLRNAEKLAAAMAALTKDLVNVNNKINEAQLIYDKNMAAGKEFSQRFNDSKKALDELKKDIMPKYIDKKSQLDKACTGIPAEVMKVYNNLRQKKIFPVVVPFVSSMCSGCHMDLAVNQRDKLAKSGDYIECPNCGRILYLE